MWQAALVREGSEPDSFWNALGGKAEYSSEKKIKEFTEDPHLFVLISSGGEQHIFFPNSLLKDDVFVLVYSTLPDFNCFKFMSNGEFGSFGIWLDFLLR